MLTSLISLLAVLSLAVVGLLVITRAVSLEEAAKSIIKVIAILILVMLAICLSRSILSPLLDSLLALLKAAIAWLLVTVFVVGLAMLVIRILFARFHVKPKG